MNTRRGPAELDAREHPAFAAVADHLMRQRQSRDPRGLAACLLRLQPHGDLGRGDRGDHAIIAITRRSNPGLVMPKSPCSVIFALWRYGMATMLIVMLAACAGVPAHGCGDGLHAAVRDELYLGTATHDGQVAADDWKRFVDDVVTPRFPQGFTVTRATGQWQAGDGATVREASHVLAVVHPDGRSGDDAVRAIADAYKARFKQESVLRVRAPACVSF